MGTAPLGYLAAAAACESVRDAGKGQRARAGSAGKRRAASDGRSPLDELAANMADLDRGMTKTVEQGVPTRRPRDTFTPPFHADPQLLPVRGCSPNVTSLSTLTSTNYHASHVRVTQLRSRPSINRKRGTIRLTAQYLRPLTPRPPPLCMNHDAPKSPSLVRRAAGLEARGEKEKNI